MSLDACLGVELDRFRLDVVELRAEAGTTIALVGPNGAGKTTALRALAGLLPLDHGSVHLDGNVLDDPATGAFVPPEHRPIGVAFQGSLLFPHLDARENIAFGLRAHGTRKRAARQRAEEWLERFGLAAISTARADSLSGGQAQRVALARALAIEPRLLLLDEPFAALDASTRPTARRLLARDLIDYDGVVILITHDPLEAMSLADKLVVLEDGVVSQRGTPEEVRDRPRSRYVAEFVGLNLYRGTAAPDGVTLVDGGALLVTARHDVTGDAFAVVHPHAVSLHRTQPEGTPRNVWRGRVEHIDDEHGRARITVGGSIPITAVVTSAGIADLKVSAGDEVWVSVKATEVAVYPA